MLQNGRSIINDVVIIYAGKRIKNHMRNLSSLRLFLAFIIRLGWQWLDAKPFSFGLELLSNVNVDPSGMVARDGDLIVFWRKRRRRTFIYRLCHNMFLPHNWSEHQQPQCLWYNSFDRRDNFPHSTHTQELLLQLRSLSEVSRSLFLRCTIVSVGLSLFSVFPPPLAPKVVKADKMKTLKEEVVLLAIKI